MAKKFKAIAIYLAETELGDITVSDSDIQNGEVTPGLHAALKRAVNLYKKLPEEKFPNLVDLDEIIIVPEKLGTVTFRVDEIDKMGLLDDD